MTIRAHSILIATAFALVMTGGLSAQGQPNAPIDLTGTWVSIVTEDWAVRMLTPRKGDYSSLPLTQAAQDAAQRTDMAALQGSGRACDVYGAPVIMREPGRVRISWQDPKTLRIDTDAGEQTRLLRFGDESAPAERARQGWSVAEWQYTNDPSRANAARGRGGRGGGFGGRGGPQDPPGGKLKVTTTHLAPGFLRKNGVPYSANATVTEYFNVIDEPNNGPKWFVVTTVVHDPENLVVDYITSTNFRKEPDTAKWRPRPCSIE